MLSRVRDFLTRHRRKFLVTGIVVGGTWFALRYAQRKLIEFQEQKAREFFENTRRIQHFESTERTCNHVIFCMGTELCSTIISQCSNDALLEQLRTNPFNKIDLWEEIKIISFTRLATLIYASSMMVVTMRIQLNLLGGYLYRDITTDQKQISEEIKQLYLSSIKYFLEEGGLNKLIDLIRSKVINLLKPMPLTKRFTLHDLEQLFWSLQMSINSDERGDPSAKMANYILSPSSSPEYDMHTPQLRRMLNETVDLLQSDDASSVCAYTICRGFSLAADAIAESLGETFQVNKASTCETTDADGPSKSDTHDISNNSETDTKSQGNNQFLNLNSMEIPLAKIIPIVSGITSKGFDRKLQPQNFATSLITFYVVAEKCKMLGANVYESFATS